MVEKKAYRVVFDYFKGKILSGEIGIGYKLPAERDIAEQLGVSRNSVREAIRMLEMMGFVESLQGSGNYICCDPHGYFTQSFNMLMVLRDISYNEIFDIRRAMEFEALTLAVQNITQEELETSRRLVLSALRMSMDSPVQLDEYYIGAATAPRDDLPVLMEKISTLTVEDIRRAAQRLTPDTIFFLKGVQG